MHPWDKDHWLPGVLSKEQLWQLIDNQYILGVNNFEDAADYSAIDLYLSDEGYQMLRGSLKPCGNNYKEFLRNPKFAQPLKPNEKGCFPLERDECYVFKLRETFDPKKFDESNIIYGQATAKSSIGRVDVIARLIVDGMHQYESMQPDDLKEHGSGEMFIEIIPISFNVCVKEGISLSQLRLFYGRPEDSEISDETFIKGILIGSEDGKGFLSVDISNTSEGGLEVAAFGAVISDTAENDYIDLWKKEPAKSRPDPCRYWCFHKVDETGRFKIENNQFYLLRSKEKISLPPGVAVYCRPMDETLGEMRIHYAGFAHPFFGTEREDGTSGTPLIFEVRGHNVDVNLQDREKLAKLIFYRMSEVAKRKPADKTKQDEKSGYGNQGLKLSNIFGKWPDRLKLIDAKKGRVEEY